MQRVLDQGYRPLAISDTRRDGLSTGFASIRPATSARDRRRQYGAGGQLDYDALAD